MSASIIKPVDKEQGMMFKKAFGLTIYIKKR